MQVDITESVELIRRAQHGDRNALDRLFERYYARVRGIVRVRLGGTLREYLESGDLVQETFVQALSGFDRYEIRDEARFLDWLSRLAENRIRDAVKHRRAGKRDPEREVSLEELRSGSSSGISPHAKTHLPDALAALGEEAGIVETCLDGMDPKLREVLVLRHYLGSTWPVVAEELGYPNEQAARVAHAKATLELCLRLRARGLS